MKFRLIPVLILLTLAACTQQNLKTPKTIEANADRTVIHLDKNWKFLQADVFGADIAATADASWQSISLPHTWNNLDGQDGNPITTTPLSPNYARIACWYRRTLTITPDMQNKTLALKFLGANRTADVFINGQHIGSHTGGFAAFAFDISRFVHPGDNLLAVRVSNVPNDNSPPLSADFTFFGGIYRPVELLILDPMHISPFDHAAPGIYVTQGDVTPDQAQINVETLLQNSSTQTQSLQLKIAVKDAAGKIVESASRNTLVNAGESTSVPVDLAINNPHLWNGRPDPYLYTVTVSLLRDGKTIDSVSQPLGIRTFSIDPHLGFILNGKPYHLHGVNRHQDRLDKGWAISNADHAQDMALIMEIGATAIRLAHYQHAEYFYELCDQNGLVIWAELPVVNEVTNTIAFNENARQQLTELIRQNYNHPSICFWSIANEVSAIHGDPLPLFHDLNALAHHEDPSRITTMAFAVPKTDEITKKDWNREWRGVTDTFGQNRYSGWYNGRGDLASFQKFLDSERGSSFAVSEYGAGSSIYYHNESPTRMDHSEEYQCLFHETYWNALKNSPNVWGTFIWNMYDFAADQRREGDHAGRNDKGLVTYDRKTKKDAFYFYKANWSEEPVLHINSKRFTTRGVDAISIKIYSNAPEVELLVNGKSLGTLANPNNSTFLWPNIHLNKGPNQILARATRNGQSLTDQTTFTYSPGAPAEVDIPQDQIMTNELKKGPPRPPPSDTPASPPTHQ